MNSVTDFSKASRGELYTIVKRIITDKPSLKSEIGNYTQAKTTELVAFANKYNSSKADTTTTVPKECKVAPVEKPTTKTYNNTLSIIDIIEKLILSKTFEVSDSDFNDIMASIKELRRKF